MINLLFQSSMESHQGENKKKFKMLKSFFPQIAEQSGLSQKDVAKVCRLLLKQIKTSIENDQVIRSQILDIKSQLIPAKPANEKRSELPERRIGRVVIRNDNEDQANK